VATSLTRFLALAFLALWPLAAPALQPEDLADTWRWRRFDREEGLPAGSIFSIGRDQDDFIYAGTNLGLLRYNGYRWTRFENTAPFEAGPVTKIAESGENIYVATQSEIWVAGYGGELHRILTGGRLHLAAGPLTGGYAVDIDTRIHYQLMKEKTSQIHEGLPLREDEIFDYVVNERGVHWLATREGPYIRDIGRGYGWKLDTDLGPLRGRPCLRLFLLKRQTITRTSFHAPVQGGILSFELWGLFEGARLPGDGTKAKHFLARRGETGWFTSTVDPSGPAIQDLLLDGEGNYLAVSDEGKVFVSSDGKEWSPAPVLGCGSVVLSDGLVDQHGYLWFRAGNSAILRFDGISRRWERFSKGLGLPSNNVLSLLESSDGRVWAGTENGVYCYLPELPGREPIPYHMVRNIPLKKVTGIAEDRMGRIWISSSEAFKGTYFFEEGFWHEIESGDSPSVNDFNIRRIATDRNGNLWFLSAWKPPRHVENGTNSRSSQKYLIFPYTVSPYTGGKFRTREIPHGPASDLLIAQDKTMWVATDQGLLRFTSDDHYRLYREEQGLRSSRIWAIAESEDGSIWICYDPSAASGVTRIKGEEVRTFDERDGLASPNARSIACSSSPIGSSTWFGTDRGILWFDGECWYNYSIPSPSRHPIGVWPLVIAGARGPRDSFEEDSILVGTTGHGIFRFRQDDRRKPRITSVDVKRTPEKTVIFFWDGRDYKNETPPDELQFRTKIDDQPWTLFGPAKTRTVNFLSPGKHTFFVEMRDGDGNGNRDPCIRTFLIPDLSSTFISPIILAVLGGAAGALAMAALVVGFLWRSLRRAGLAAAPVDGIAVLAGFPGAVLVLDGKGKILQITGSRLEALGLPSRPGKELEGCSAEILPLFQSEPARSSLRRLVGGGDEIVLNGAPMGSGERSADAIGIPLRTARNRGRRRDAAAVILVEEVTVRRTERELRERSRRLHALQDLSSRISGEFSRLEKDSSTAQLLEDLGRFAGPGSAPASREPLLLGELVECLAGGRKGGQDSRPPADVPPVEVPRGVEIKVSSQTELWRTPGDRREILLALREILRNAVDSMPDGGRVTVRLRNRRIDSDPGELPGGPYVSMEVQDSGTGISPSELGRILEPFFSTKPRDRARGIGLSMAYGILRRHRGDLRIQSTPGAGTTVTVLLPADPGA